MKFAIVENEFGDVGVDDGVLKQTSEDQIIEMMRGAASGSVAGDRIGRGTRAQERLRMLHSPLRSGQGAQAAVLGEVHQVRRRDNRDDGPGRPSACGADLLRRGRRAQRLPPRRHRDRGRRQARASAPKRSEARRRRERVGRTSGLRRPHSPQQGRLGRGGDPRGRREEDQGHQQPGVRHPHDAVSG